MHDDAGRGPGPTLVELSSATLADRRRRRGVAVPTYDRARLSGASSTSASAGSTGPTSRSYTDDLAAAGSTGASRGLGVLAGDAGDGRRPATPRTACTRWSSGATTNPRCRSSAASPTMMPAAADPAAAVATLADPTVAIVVVDHHRVGLRSRVGADVRAARRRPRPPPPRGFAAGHDPQLRQPARQRRRRPRRHATAAAEVGAGAGGVGRAALHVPELDGRPHHAGDERRRPGVAAPQTYGIVDRWPVVAEPFRQWVVEDHFVAGRPRVGGRRRAVQRRRPVVGALQAAHAQRHPLDHGLPVRAGRHHLRRRGDGRRRPCAPTSSASSPTRRSRRCSRSPATPARSTPPRSSSASPTRACATRSPGCASTARPSSPPSSCRRSSTTSPAAGRSPVERWPWPGGPGTSGTVDAGRAVPTRTATRPAGRRGRDHRTGAVPRLRPGCSPRPCATTSGSAPRSSPRTRLVADRGPLATMAACRRSR